VLVKLDFFFVYGDVGLGWGLELDGCGLVGGLLGFWELMGLEC
jgi:hypothetical protein